MTRLTKPRHPKPRSPRQRAQLAMIRQLDRVASDRNSAKSYGPTYASCRGGLVTAKAGPAAVSKHPSPAVIEP
jgi:hypothetical protein